MFSTRLLTVPLGMRTTARQPSSRAVQATPRPWLPSVAVKNTAFPSAARAASPCERRVGHLLRPQPQPRGDVPADGIGTAQHLEGVQPKALRFVLDTAGLPAPVAPPAPESSRPAAWARTGESCGGRRAPDAPVRPSARGSRGSPAARVARSSICVFCMRDTSFSNSIAYFYRV